MADGLTLRHSPPAWRRGGRIVADVQALYCDELLHAAQVALNKDTDRARFVKRLLERANGHAIDGADVEARLLRILHRATSPEPGPEATAGDAGDGDDAPIPADRADIDDAFSADEADRPASQATRLVELASDAELFLSP